MSEVRPWVSWVDTHWGYSRVFQFPRVLLDPVSAYSLETPVMAPSFTRSGSSGSSDSLMRQGRTTASWPRPHQTFWMHHVLREHHLRLVRPFIYFISLPLMCADLSSLQYGQIWYWLEDWCFASSAHHSTNRIKGFFRLLFRQALYVDHRRRL